MLVRVVQENETAECVRHTLKHVRGFILRFHFRDFDLTEQINRPTCDKYMCCRVSSRQPFVMSVLEGGLNVCLKTERSVQALCIPRHLPGLHILGGPKGGRKVFAQLSAMLICCLNCKPARGVPSR